MTIFHNNYSGGYHHHHPLLRSLQSYHHDSMMFLTPHRTVVTSYTPYKRRRCRLQQTQKSTDSGDSILHLHTNATQATVALSNGTVQIYDIASMHQQLQFEPSMVSSSSSSCASARSLCSMWRSNNDNNNDTMNDAIDAASMLLVTTWDSGCVIGTDLRCPCYAPAWHVVHHHAESSSCTQAALLLEGGGSHQLLLVGDAHGVLQGYDLRKLQQQQQSNNNNNKSSVLWKQKLHTAAITQVKVSSSSNDLITTGGRDGRVCSVSCCAGGGVDATPIVQDQQFSAPVRRLGVTTSVCGGSGGYCITEDEALHVWSSNCSSSTTTTPLYQLRNSLRSNHHHVSYLIDGYFCIDRGAGQTNSLLVAAGNQQGDLVLVDSGGVVVTTTTGSSGPHTGRIVAWAPLINGRGLLTAGTDARLCEWTFGCACAGANEAHDEDDMVATTVKRQRRDTSTTGATMVISMVEE